MSATEQQPSFNDIKSEILAATPDRCQGCYTPELLAGFLADQVIEGKKTVESAQTELEANISGGCKYGLEDVGGCFGGSQCNMGVLCKMPPPLPRMSGDFNDMLTSSKEQFPRQIEQ